MIASASRRSLRRRAATIAVTPPTLPTAVPTASPAPMAAADNRRKNVVAVNASDNSTNDHTVIHAMMFWRRVFTHGPGSARSLQSRTRNTVAEGSRTPASACTPWVTQAENVVGAERQRHRHRQK